MQLEGKRQYSSSVQPPVNQTPQVFDNDPVEVFKPRRSARLAEKHSTYSLLAAADVVKMYTDDHDGMGSYLDMTVHHLTFG
jgi:hypothetical protein